MPFSHSPSSEDFPGWGPDDAVHTRRALRALHELTEQQGEMLRHQSEALKELTSEFQELRRTVRDLERKTTR
jgi:hypothetical protein